MVFFSLVHIVKFRHKWYCSLADNVNVHVQYFCWFYVSGNMKLFINAVMNLWIWVAALSWCHILHGYGMLPWAGVMFCMDMGCTLELVSCSVFCTTPRKCHQFWLSSSSFCITYGMISSFELSMNLFMFFVL